MAGTGRLDLLQITLVVRDMPATELAFHEALGLEVAFRDPSVDLWGLENVVLPMGTTFIEILAPTRENTPGGRHLDRQGGDGGYMVILQTPDVAPWRERIDALGLRVAFEMKTEEPADGDSWEGIHLHPNDTGGMMISFDNPQPTTSWAGAGPDWRDHIRQDVVDGLVAITLRSPDPGKLAARWGEVLDREVRIEQLPEQPGDVKQTWADPTRIEQELGFRPRIEIRDGLERFAAWFLAERKAGRLA